MRDKRKVGNVMIDSVGIMDEAKNERRLVNGRELKVLIIYKACDKKGRE